MWLKSRDSLSLTTQKHRIVRINKQKYKLGTSTHVSSMFKRGVIQ